jgi:hypothetical protein
MKQLQLASFKQLRIDNSGTAMDCFEMPLAYAASVYNHDFFYAYILISHYIKNWGKPTSSLIENTNNILKEMDISLKLEITEDKKSFCSFVKNSINDGNPVFLAFDYYYMFYDTDHYLINHIPHGVLITGYDEQRKILLLQESAHMKFTALYPLALTEDIVYDIWTQSCKYSRESMLDYNNLLFSFCYSPDKTKGFSIFNILSKYYCASEHKPDQFVSILDHLDREYLTSSVGGSWFRREFCTRHRLIFDFIDLLLEKENLVRHEFTFYKLKNEFIEFREISAGKIMRAAFTGKELDKTTISQIKFRIEELNKYMLEAIFEVVNIIFELNGKYNFALNCKTIASSESNFKGMNFSSQRTVDGFGDNNTLEGMWASNTEDPVHWLIFDLEKSINIKMFR